MQICNTPQIKKQIEGKFTLEVGQKTQAKNLVSRQQGLNSTINQKEEIKQIIYFK